MQQKVHHPVLNQRGYHRLKLEHYFWRGYVQNLTTVTTFSTSTQILIKHYYIRLAVLPLGWVALELLGERCRQLERLRHWKAYRAADLTI